MIIKKNFNPWLISLYPLRKAITAKDLEDKQVISLQSNKMSDNPISKIQNNDCNMLKGLIKYETLKKCLAKQNTLPLVNNVTNKRKLFGNTDLKTYQSTYPNYLYSKKVNIKNNCFVGFVMKETYNKIVIFKDYCQRFDIPKLKIHEVRENVILNMNENEFMSYEVNIFTSLPTE